jgi:type II secretory pathway pseudopilin PulG
MAPRRFLMVVAGLVSVVGATLLYAAAEQADTSKAALEQQLKEVLKSRAESARAALSSMQAAFEAETVTFSDLADASKKLAEAEVGMAMKPEEEIVALGEYLERTKQAEHKIKLLYVVGTKGGEAKEYHAAKRERESAEILLLQARIKAMR